MEKCTYEVDIAEFLNAFTKKFGLRQNSMMKMQKKFSFSSLSREIIWHLVYKDYVDDDNGKRWDYKKIKERYLVKELLH